MIGAIIGDIVGSVYEWDRIKTKSFEFFNDNGFVTDDSVCTAAVADALLHDRAPAAALQDWCRRYPNASYGGSFRSWIWMDPACPYNSFGNGAGMRVSPAAYLNRDNLASALEASDLVTAVTHNHPEGLKGAGAHSRRRFVPVHPHFGSIGAPDLPLLSENDPSPLAYAGSSWRRRDWRIHLSPRLLTDLHAFRPGWRSG